MATIQVPDLSLIFNLTKLPKDQEDLLNSWVLIATPWPVLSILVGYLSFVLWLGPWFMQHRKPFQLTRFMMMYNLYQVLYNGALVAWFVFHPHALNYVNEHYCHPLDPAKNPLRHEFLLSAWYYYFSKITDMVDTILLVLRKKNSHVTFLHLYHHTTMVGISWIFVKYIQAEECIVLGVVNSFVHVVMYFYYFLAGMGPEVQKYLCWKKYITKLQLLQFVIAISYMLYLLYSQCTVSQVFNVVYVTNVAVIMAFFINFYIQSYIRKPALLAKDQRKNE